jgi:hypothetical protein
MLVHMNMATKSRKIAFKGEMTIGPSASNYIAEGSFTCHSTNGG